MTRTDGRPEVGSEVTVCWGRYGGRNGTLLRYDEVERGGGRSSVYPVVLLHHTATTGPRTVRVLTVTDKHRTTIHPDLHVTCVCGEFSQRFGTDANARRWILDHHSRMGLSL